MIRRIVTAGLAALLNISGCKYVEHKNPRTADVLDIEWDRVELMYDRDPSSIGLWRATFVKEDYEGTRVVRTFDYGDRFLENLKFDDAKRVAKEFHAYAVNPLMLL